MSRIFPFVLIALGAWLGAQLPITDSSYLDLAHGRQIAETGRLTAPDTLLLPASPSETSGWLGTWILFRAHRAGDELGLRLFGAFCLAAGALLLYLVQPSGAGFTAAAAAVSLAGSTLDLSTSVFSWPLVALMVYGWSTLRPKNKWWLLLLILPLGAWPFLNRESLMGFALAALALGTSLVQAVRLARRQERARGRLLAFQEPLLFAAAGAAAVMLVISTSPGQQLVGNPVREALWLREAGGHGWQSVSLVEDPLYFLLAVVTGLLALAAPPLAMPFEALAGSSFLLLSLLSRHFVAHFAAVAVPLACRGLSALGESARFSSLPIVRPLRGRWTALVSGVAVMVPTALAFPNPHPFAGAVRYLSEHVMEQRLFNVPRAGGLTSWSGGPNRLPFAYLRPSSVEAFQSETTEKRLAQIFTDHDLELALLSRDFADRRAEELAQLETIRLLYFDQAALLYALSDANAEYTDVLTFDYLDPLLPPSEYAEEEVPLAIQELFLYFDRYPPAAATLWTLGRLLLRADRREEALEAFEAAHRLDPDDLEILRELSRLYVEKGMYRLAERSTRRALQLFRDEEFVYNLALSLYGQAQYAEAAREFEVVLELNEENLKARQALVDLYRHLGALEKSYQQKQILDAMIESRTSALLSKARERHEALDFAAEAELYEQALEVNQDPELFWGLAMALLTDERVAEATNVLRALLDVAPRNVEARLTLGVLCLEEPTCTPEEARTHLEAFLQLAPDDINAELAQQRLGSLETLD